MTAVNKAMRIDDSGQKSYWEDHVRSISQSLNAFATNAQKALKKGTFDPKEVKAYESAIQDLRKQMQLLNAEQRSKNVSSEQAAGVKKIKDAYDDLSRSIREYNAQVGAGDLDGASKTKAHIQGLIEEYGQLKQMTDSGLLTGDNLEKANAILQKMRVSMTAFTAAIREGNAQVSIMDGLLQQAGERLLSMANQAILRGLLTMWRDAISYTETYYDSLNEIRIVTMRSQEEADALGARYRENARE